MPLFLVFFSEFQTFALEGVDVHNDRFVGVLDLLESIDKGSDVVPVSYVKIFKAHRFE